MEILDDLQYMKWEGIGSNSKEIYHFLPTSTVMKASGRDRIDKVCDEPLKGTNTKFHQPHEAAIKLHLMSPYSTEQRI